MATSYYNTTSEKGDQLKKNVEQAKTQDQRIKEMFDGGYKLSASLIFPRMNCPITSIRRSLNTLENAGKIRKLDFKIMGLYGRKEYLYVKAK